MVPVTDMHDFKAIRAEAGRTLRLAWPIIAAQLLQLSMVLVDNMMVGHLGPQSLAGMAIASTLYNLSFVCSLGVLSAVGTLIAQAHGGQEPQRMQHLMRQGFYVTLLLSTLTIAIFWNASTLLLWAGQDAAIVAIADGFLRVLAWGMPAQLGYVWLRQFIEANSDTRPSFIITLGAALLNAALGYALIFGNFGVPRLEIAGSALATLTVSWLMLVAMALYIRHAKRYSTFRPWGRPWQSELRFDGRAVGEILRLGLPSGGMWLCEVGFFAGTTLLMGKLGTLAVAAHQVAINFAAFTFMIPLGLSTAVCIRVGQEVGGNDWRAVRVTVNTGLILGCLCVIVPMVLYLGAPQMVTRLYTKSPELITLAAQLLTIAGIFQLFDGIQVVGAAILRGMRDTRIPFLVTLLAYWIVGIPAGVLMGFFMGMGARGLWYSLVLGLGVAAMLHYIRIRRKLSAHSGSATMPDDSLPDRGNRANDRSPALS